MDSVELKRLRALLAAQAAYEAARRPSRTARLLAGFARAWADLAAAGRRALTRDPPRAVAYAPFVLAPRPPEPPAAAVDPTPQPAGEPCLEAYAMTGFAPRRTTFGCRDDAPPAPRAAPQEPLVEAPAPPPEPWSPLSGGFQPHDAETPFFPEDLADGHEDDTPVWVPSRRLRLALAPPPEAVSTSEPDETIPPALARDYLLADLASRLAGEQTRLDTHRRVAKDLDFTKLDASAGQRHLEPAKAA